MSKFDTRGQMELDLTIREVALDQAVRATANFRNSCSSTILFAQRFEHYLRTGEIKEVDPKDITG